jgi:hypothetical protein
MNNDTCIRFLENDELHLVKQLAEETKSLMRQKNYDQFGILENTIYCGTFNKDNELIASIAAIRWKMLPYYTITQYYAKPGVKSVFSWKNNPAVKMTDTIIDLMEKENRFTWYYSRSIEKWPRKLRIKGNDFFSVSEKCKNYTRHIEEIVSKNTLSEYEGHGRQLPKVAWPYDIIVVKCCLKNQFRPFEYKFEEDYNEVE